jgi:hypothetical protein
MPGDPQQGAGPRERSWAQPEVDSNLMETLSKFVKTRLDLVKTLLKPLSFIQNPLKLYSDLLKPF